MRVLGYQLVIIVVVVAIAATAIAHLVTARGGEVTLHIRH